MRAHWPMRRPEPMAKLGANPTPSRGLHREGVDVSLQHPVGLAGGIV